MMWENRGQLGESVQTIIATRSSDEWLEVFEPFDVPVNRIATIEEAPTDIQILENHMAQRPADPTMGVELLVNHPIQVTSVPQVAAHRAPTHGEHSAEILRELGYADTTIDELRERGVI